MFSVAMHLFGSFNFIRSNYAPLLFTGLGSLFLLFALSYSRPIQFSPCFMLIFCFTCTLKAHVHPSGFARLSFCFGRVRLLNAVFWLAVISQRTIFNYAKFPQCIQGDNYDRVIRKTTVKQLRFNNPIFYRLQDNAAVKIMATVIGVLLLCCGHRLYCEFASALKSKRSSEYEWVIFI